VPDFADLLRLKLPEEEADELRRHERTGRPLGSEAFVARISKMLGRDLVPGKAGRKPKRGR